MSSKSLTVHELIDLAKDQYMTAEKLSQLIAYNTVVFIEEAKGKFQNALRKVQAALPIIEKNETITFKDGRTGSYAPNDEIQEIVGPIIRKHGFTLTFQTTYPQPGLVNVRGTLAHKDGHETYSDFAAKVDFSGGKTDTQGRGSVIWYGHRYTSLDVLNIIVRGKDDDGKTELVDEQPKPEGYAVFMSKLYDAARIGTTALQAQWIDEPIAMRELVPTIQWDEMKAMAEKADVSNLVL